MNQKDRMPRDIYCNPPMIMDGGRELIALVKHLQLLA
jgi:hypothetical protein